MDEVRLIEVREEIMSDTKRLADELRTTLKQSKTYLLNLMSSPGAGKTSLIINLIKEIGSRLRVGVIEADIDSKVDAEKLVSKGIKAVQLRTGGFCHLDANMVSKGLEALELQEFDLIIIENVGNLVCPAEFDTGAHLNVMLLSVPEGDDKPLKYPLMFSVSQVLVIHKIDYLTLSDFDLVSAKQRATALNPSLQIFEISSKTGQGCADLANWLVEQVDNF